MSLEGDLVLLGSGKRTYLQEPQESSIPCFYFPDFFLTDQKPWFIHEHWRLYHAPELIDSIEKNIDCPFNEAQISIDWIPPDWSIFESSFHELQTLFAQGILKKAVPFVFEKSRVQMSHQLLSHALKQMLQYIQRNPAKIYGCWDEEKGILGASPEILFSLNSEKSLLTTMACAGTAHSLHRDQELLHDHKELCEHKWVIEGITQSLSPFGSVRCGETKIVPLPGLSHLVTPIEVVLEKSFTFDALIAALHPTPALGAYPKKEGFLWLMNYQTMVDRKQFGAPAAVQWMGHPTYCLVAIRNVQWDSKGLLLGAGCGVIPQSQLVKEKQEIIAKLQAIKNMLAF